MAVGQEIHGQKRKKASGGQEHARKLKKSRLDSTQSSKAPTSHKIEDLEAQILDSQKNYNKINELLEYTKETVSAEIQRKARLALCTIFSQLLAEEKIVLDGPISKQGNVIDRWLVKKYEQYYEGLLLGLSQEGDLTSRLLMQLVKQEVSSATSNQIWTTGLYPKILKSFLEEHGEGLLFEDFAAEHILPHKDTRMHACRNISTLNHPSVPAIDKIISFLTSIPLIKDNDEEPTSCLATLAPKSKRKPPSNTAYKTTLEEAWLSILSNTLSPPQRQRLLTLIPHTIAPSISKAEKLSDFLIDAFDAGGTESLSALAGIYHLMQHKNLDYPDFYTKLYSLLDAHILHSAHRSDFLRLMITFLSSTHLPASLVASFIKRLARLCLHAPPGAIIAITPWIYNMLQSHPTCASLIHRTTPQDSDSGIDPFLPTEANPLHTRALESSLWDLHTLAEHFHPNVATIASVIARPFTKREYKLVDFEGYTYEDMLGGELKRAVKAGGAVVQWRIPKRVFLRDHGEDEEDGGLGGGLMRGMWRFD